MTTSKKTVNLAQKWVTDSGKTLEQARIEYDGACVEFAGDFLEAIGRGRLAYFNDIGHPTWKYHAAAEIDGMVHDLWIDEVMSIKRFLKKIMQGGWVDYPAEERKKMNSNKQMAEEATGIRENSGGLGIFYMKGEIVVVPQDVPKIIRMGHVIEVPNAGAGSYKRFFIDVAGYTEVKSVETGSSAGDWTLTVCEGEKWYLAFQFNRHPYHGFAYHIVKHWWPTFEDLCRHVTDECSR